MKVRASFLTLRLVRFQREQLMVMVQRIPEGTNLTKLAEQTQDPVTLGPIFPQRPHYAENSVPAGFRSMPLGICRDSGATNQPMLHLWYFVTAALIN